MTDRPTILHISADVPDVLVPAKTRAIVELLDGTPAFDHRLFSINRVDGWSGMAAMEMSPARTALAYRAPPKGLLLARGMDRLADDIAGRLAAEGTTPDLVHAHKLSIEGLAGIRLAERFGVPLVVSLQGHTDVRVVGVKKGLRRRYGAILQRAAHVVPFAPWARDRIQAMTGVDLAGKSTLLPVMTAADALMTADSPGNGRLATVFHLDLWRLKGLDIMVAALEKLAAAGRRIELDVYGGGSPTTLMAVRALLDGSPAGGQVRLMGPVPHAQIQTTLARYAGFAMPTKSESYGLVHMEALFSGLPILWSRGRGIDGYLPAERIGMAVDPMSADAVADGMAHLIDREAPLKAAIAAMQAAGDLEYARRPAILATYEAILRGAI